MLILAQGVFWNDLLLIKLQVINHKITFSARLTYVLCLNVL